MLTMACLGALVAAHAKEPRATPAGSADRDALWRKIHDACAAAAARGTYPPAPCAEVDANGTHAVLKDRVGRYQYLVLPLARVTGIESPALLAPGAPDYFAAAWTARLYLEAALHRRLPRDEVILAVNSAYGRSQDQLHIHVDCIRPDVHDALHRLLPTLAGPWRRLEEPLPPHGHAYWARWVAGGTLPVDPFKSLAAALPAGDRMAQHSLAVVGARAADGRPGFILLSGRADPSGGDRGSSDELQDHTCAIAASSPRHRSAARRPRQGPATGTP